MNDKARGALVGLAVGDALGAYVEFEDYGTYPRLTDYQAGGPFNLQPGQYTDDGSHALCLAETLLVHTGFVAEDFIDRLCKWLFEGHNSSTGEAFDVGTGTRLALTEYRLNGSCSTAILKNSGGNGGLMRLGPAVIASGTLHNAKLLAIASTAVTHQHPSALRSSVLFGGMLYKALQAPTTDKTDLAKSFKKAKVCLYDKAVQFWLGCSDEQLTRPVRNCSGYCVDSLIAAYQCFFETDNFEAAVVEAVNRGGDTDTVGAITGQLAGAFYGYSQIPERFLKVQDHNRFVALADELSKLQLENVKPNQAASL